MILSDSPVLGIGTPDSISGEDRGFDGDLMRRRVPKPAGDSYSLYLRQGAPLLNSKSLRGAGSLSETIV